MLRWAMYFAVASAVMALAGAVALVLPDGALDHTLIRALWGGGAMGVLMWGAGVVDRWCGR